MSPPVSPPAWPARLATQGFVIVPHVLTPTQIASLLAAIHHATEGQQLTGRGGWRNLLDRVPTVRGLANTPVIRQLVEPILGPQAFVARAILFDKTPDANWKVPWHQDLTIAVDRQFDLPGFGPWTIKDGIQHVQPPTAILEQMLAVRLHLDPCADDNGPVRVIPASHLHGRLTTEQIQAIQTTQRSISCTVRAGDALLMRPLLLHASSVATSPQHRRVIHLEFATGELPGGLRWEAATKPLAYS